MNEHYFLKLGPKEVIGDDLAAALESGEEAVKKAAETKLDGELKEFRTRVGTLLKTDNVGFLLAAGCSMAAGGVSLATIPTQIERQLLSGDPPAAGNDVSPWLELFYAGVSALLQQPFSATVRRAAFAAPNAEVAAIPINLESYLTQLHTWRAAMPADVVCLQVGPADAAFSINRDALDELIKRVNRALAAQVNLPADGRESALATHRRFIRKILTRPLNLRRANIYTLNYDTLIEQAADGEGTILVDGFVGTLRRVFRPESYSLDFYFPAQTTEGRVHRFDRALHLYKLHGSITWHRTAPNWENPYGLFATHFNRSAPDDDVLIFPTPLKYGLSLGMPYSELFRHFGSTISQPQSVLFVIGYSFCDEHVNALIRQALAIPSFTLVVISPSPNSEFITKLNDLGDERVWIVGGRKLGTFEKFVDKLLPDLREEEIAAKVIRTFRALDSNPPPAEPGLPNQP